MVIYKKKYALTWYIARESNCVILYTLCLFVVFLRTIFTNILQNFLSAVSDNQYNQYSIPAYICAFEKEMMNQEEGENGFELVDKPRDGGESNSSLVFGPVPLPTWIPQPTLPVNLASGPTPILLPVSQFFPSTSTPVTSNVQPQSFAGTVPVTPITHQV